MLKALAKTPVSIRVALLLTFLISLSQTYAEWARLNALFQLQGDNDIDIYPVDFRTSLGFTIILFGAALSAISSRLSKFALVLLTIIFIAYWIMFFESGSELRLPFGSRDQFSFARNLTYVFYQLAPLIALLTGYVIWWKRLNYRSIALTGLLCVMSQFLIWFVGTRLIANSDSAGTSYQYPPITIYATFVGATWGHVILLVLCTATMLALIISMKRDRRNEEFKHL